jgi:hypothetical protein
MISRVMSMISANGSTQSPSSAAPEADTSRVRPGTWLVAALVAIAFADSSIVVLALPQLYSRFETSITGVSWIVTSYNAAVAVTALALVFFVHRFRARFVFVAGALLFLAASIACASAQALWFLIVARCAQGAGAGLLLAGALSLLAVNVWTLAGTFGAALGPALGGILTQLFDWRAIFIAQAPVAAAGIVAAWRREDEPTAVEGWRPALRRTVPANVALGLVFGALVGALFLGVLLVIIVWQYTPIEGALIVSVLPLAAFAARALPRKPAAGAALLGAGLVALALLPSANVPIAMCALALCGVGLGIAVPPLSNTALDVEAGLTRSGTLTVGARHLGLVAAIATIAPLLANTLPDAGDRAMLKATQVLLDAPIGITDKIPIALDLRKAFNQAKTGEIPNLKEPFDSRGARSDPTLAAARDDLVSAIQNTITRAFRSSFFLAAAFAAAGALVAWRLIP